MAERVMMCLLSSSPAPYRAENTGGVSLRYCKTSSEKPAAQQGTVTATVVRVAAASSGWLTRFDGTRARPEARAQFGRYEKCSR